MILELTEAQRTFQAQVAQFARERVAPLIAAIDEDGRFPRDLVTEAAAAVLLGMQPPEAWGGRADVSCARALANGLGDWRATVEFVLCPYAFGRDLAELSAIDVARAAERDVDAFCRQGFGALLAKLAAGIPVQLSTPVTQLDISGRGGRIEARTGSATIRAPYVIVTVSTGVLSAGKIAFTPELPKRQLDAAGQLRLGSYDRIALELASPLGLRRDDLVLEKAADARTAALLANVSDTSLAYVDIGGKFGRELSDKGERAMIDFAVEWLTGLYGPDARNALKRTACDPLERRSLDAGGVSGAAPNGQGAPGPDGTGARPALFRRRGRARTLWGHGRRRLGIGRARRRGDPARWACSRRRAGAQGAAAAARRDRS